MIIENGWLVTMDDADGEYARGWLQIEDGMIAALGAGDAPERGEDLRGAVVTPGFVNTHHHLYQTLTRARAADADLFTWLKTLYPVWARIDDQMVYAAARCGLAANDFTQLAHAGSNIACSLGADQLKNG